MTDRSWGYFFIRTDDGLRTRPLRDYDLNERIGFVILAIVLVVAAVGKSVGAW